jgi:hypothetical protein
MSDKKISQLTSSTTPLAGTEVLPIVQGGATKKVASDDASIEKLAVFSQIFFDSLSTELEKIQKARGK